MPEIDSRDLAHVVPARNQELLACAFRLGTNWFAVDAQWVQEINSQTSVTVIPHAPAAVHGYVNLRGHLRLVLDVRALLGVRTVAQNAQPRLIVFKPTAGESFAILVDQVGDMRALAPEQIDRPTSSQSVSMGATQAGWAADSLTVGYAKLDHQLLALLDPRRFLEFALGTKRPANAASARPTRSTLDYVTQEWTHASSER